MQASTLTIGTPSSDGIFGRLKPRGKFLYSGDQKVYLKGVAYGAFPPNSQGHQFPEKAGVDQDFRLMREAGINSILTYTVPPLSMLDQAHEHGLGVVVNIPWMAYVCFLEGKFAKQVRDQVRDAVASCQKHPAVTMVAVAKELRPPIVRWYGQKKIQTFLKDLYDLAKNEDPDTLVTYTNYPTTEYLQLPFVDVLT